MEKFHQTNLAKLLLTLIAMILFATSISSVVQGFKTNLSHSDASENFQTVTVWNSYFLSHHFETRPTVVTILSPYQADFFSNHSFELLPLSKKQYFTNSQSQTWGIPEGLNYLDLYRSYLSQKKPLFVSNYHTGPDFIFWKDFLSLKQNFQLTKVADGCDGECDLYQIDSSSVNPPY